MTEVNLTWKEGLLFEAEQDNLKFFLDVGEAYGGTGKGVGPKALLLSGLAGCSGMDVVSLLKKMRVEGYSLHINVKGDVADEHPKVYTNIELTFNFEGENLPDENLRKAVELSITRYCPVYIMLHKAVPIKTRIFNNKTEVSL